MVVSEIWKPVRIGIRVWLIDSCLPPWIITVCRLRVVVAVVVAMVAAFRRAGADV